MVEVGRLNRLQVVKAVDFGVFLYAEELDNVLLPKRYVPENTQIGDMLDVFIYLDSEDDYIATTETPRVMVGECAYLKVTDVNRMGAFMDWGLPKDLLVPFSEQHMRFEVGQSHMVYVYVDAATDRIVASSKLNRHLPERFGVFKPGQAVQLQVWGKSELGYKVVIENSHLGLLFRDDAFRPVRFGEKIEGYIKSIRPDGKINVSLQLPAGQGRDELCEKILEYLEAHGGVSDLGDKADPKEVHRLFRVSKNNYKKALGKLYKGKKINITPEGITLL
ncbi:S1 RNA-binding domain-containing protein [Marinibactrum halimedae]|uniref:GntR family transcriptional regulator n=1 Tax=Marinibactrum halimedae TaxID=1444977 RepID=A0AA37T9C6_9GAMM|nr:S1-like domain-containing RNA-binding protein [Marinibactrum halimedae]MCD9458173.1 S1-like domain-containing RNA-binding protein [Marinibactrum halimedae]GLS25107.1 hypothetical protein GCM10007877_08210 [Marinibactrum halimedae]